MSSTNPLHTLSSTDNAPAHPFDFEKAESLANELADVLDDQMQTIASLNTAIEAAKQELWQLKKLEQLNTTTESKKEEYRNRVKQVFSRAKPNQQVSSHTKDQVQTRRDEVLPSFHLKKRANSSNGMPAQPVHSKASKPSSMSAPHTAQRTTVQEMSLFSIDLTTESSSGESENDSTQNI